MSVEEWEVHSCDSVEGSVSHQVWVCPLGVGVSTSCGCVAR